MRGVVRTFAACFCLFISLPWPVVMGYLLYLGFSTGQWLSDKFLYWEGISWLCTIPLLLGLPTAITLFVDNRNHDEQA